MTQRFTRTAAFASIVAIALASAPGAFAASEVGDAGDLPATSQDLGAGPVTTIWGTYTDAADADVYRICLSDGESFSASTVGATTLDTQMFLLDSQGYGIYANDDASGSRGSLLPAQHRFSPSVGGEYFLAISSYNRDPQSVQGEIFRDNFSPGTYPDGVLDANGFGAEDPIVGWAGRAPGGPGLYRITLTGTASCDATPPTVDLRSPLDGGDVAQGADVVVDYSCADEGGSGLTSCVGTTPDGVLLDTSELGEVSVTVTARDGAGNETVVTHTVTVVDETKPTVTLTTPADGAVYAVGQHVVADYACADEPGGSGMASCSGTAAAGSAIDTASAGEKTFTVEATDNAGNTASKSVTYSVMDSTPPSIELTTPADGAFYAVGADVPAAYSCTDEAGGSGVVACDGTVANGALIDTSSFGQHSFEVNASDAAGNSSSRIVTYTVGYDFDGFLWPVKNPPSANRWKAGTPVPIRFSLNGFHGSQPEASGYPRSTRCGGGDLEPAARGSKKKPAFRYVRRSDTYVMLWKTQRKWAGSCREFTLKLDDGSVHTAEFDFVKHGRGHDKHDDDEDEDDD